MATFGILIVVLIILSCGVFLGVRVWIARRQVAQQITDEIADRDECMSIWPIGDVEDVVVAHPKGVGRAPTGQALVSDEARKSGLHPTGFDPSRGEG